MKKFFALFCVAAALTFVAGCGKKEAPPASAPPADGGAAPAEKPAEGTNP
jgi:predicted small lipoprotein YifL